MKKWFAGILLMVCMLGASALYAAPERIAIKDAAKNAKERTATAQIRAIDLRDIEDPAARKAIREIINYLDLKSADVAAGK